MSSIQSPVLRSLLFGVAGVFIGAFVTYGILYSRLQSTAIETEMGASTAAISSASAADSLARDGASEQGSTPSPDEASGYALLLDRPDVRERLAKRDEKLLAMLMDQHRAEYQKLFGELGVSVEDSEDLLNRIKVVYRAKLEAREVMTQLVYAQTDFDKHAKSLLGEKYDAYRDYEDAQKSREESNQIAEFLQESQMPAIPSDRLIQLQNVIEENGAYSRRTLGSIYGPLSELEAPRGGKQSVLPFLEQSQALLQVNSDAVLKRARELQFPPHEIEALEKYYRKQLEQYGDQISAARNPLGARLTRLEAELSVKQAESNANPADIAKLQRRIDSMKAYIEKNSTP